jgi:hypothetical protein
VVLSLAEGGPFDNTMNGIFYESTAFNNALNWANGLGDGWFQSNTSYYRSTLAPAITSLGGGDYMAGLAAFNTAVTNLNSRDGTSYPLIKYAGDAAGSPTTQYWTSEANTAGGALSLRTADAWNFATQNVTDIRQTTEGNYARAYRNF